MLRSHLAWAGVLCLCVAAHAQEPEPTPARSPAGSAQAARIDAATAAKILAETYARCKDATTADDFGQVIEVCERALAAQPLETVSKYAHELAAWAYNRRGEVYADQAAALFNQGQERQATELDALALDDFRAAVGHDPAKWKAIHNRGVSLALHGKIDEALADFDQALKLNPDFVNSRFNRAEIRAQQSKWQAAIEDYSAVLALKADDLGAMLGRGAALLKSGKPDKALADFELALRYAPSSAAALTGRAEVHMAAGRWNAAGEDYRQAIQADAKFARGYCGAAWLMATCPDEQFRDSELAFQSANKAIELEGDSDWNRLDALAAAQASAGRFGEAQATIAKAIQIAPPHEAPALQARLALYRDRQPYRQTQR